MYVLYIYSFYLSRWIKFIKSIVAGQEALIRRDIKTWTLIHDLEEAVFNLKEHLLNVDASSRSSKTDQTDIDVVGKQCCASYFKK